MADCESFRHVPIGSTLDTLRYADDVVGRHAPLNHLFLEHRLEFQLSKAEPTEPEPANRKGDGDRNEERRNHEGLRITEKLLHDPPHFRTRNDAG